MNETQREICLQLIEEANTKGEVVEVMSTTFRSINTNELKLFVSKHWGYRVPKNRVSIRHTSYTDKHTILESLITRRRLGQIKNIYVYLNKGLSKNTPYKTYLDIIGRDFNKPGREALRGMRVKFIGFGPDNIKINVLDLREGGEVYVFCIYDINVAHYIEFD